MRWLELPGLTPRRRDGEAVVGSALFRCRSPLLARGKLAVMRKTMVRSVPPRSEEVFNLHRS